MRLAFVSPMPPAKSGIADYSAALLDPLRQLAEVEVFSSAPSQFDPARYDAIIYQIGNNGHHAFVYEMALAYPGIVVLHEANLHHLITDITIRRNRWDLYITECEFDGGAEALAFAQRVRALEVGPDYSGVLMLRRILQASRGVLVHNQYCANVVRAQGFSGPVGVIPHGAWLPAAIPAPWRSRLGIDESTPLIGIFGFLKPYKRIRESLRAFRRLLRFEPRAKMILAGEAHPEFPLAELIRSLDLGSAVRVLGFIPEEDFMGYVSACDIVLNLRFPTVGESSGSLMRALGLGKACIVSDVGSFSELPESVCLKVPIDAREEDTLFEYMNLLVSRPALAQTLGQQAREWVQKECSWPQTAKRYVTFARCVLTGEPFEQAVLAEPPAPEAPRPEITPEYVLGWAADPGAEEYIGIHQSRLIHTLEITPPGTPDSRILEMGAYMQITPSLRTKLGYGTVRGCYYGPQHRVDHRRVVSRDGEEFECEIDHFDAERDPFPYENDWFDTVICGELIEHLMMDPMHMMSELNRILKPGGHLVLTTPNIASMRAVAAILQGNHPGFFPAYLRPDLSSDPRHAREYTAGEIWQLFYFSGLEPEKIETAEFRHEPRPYKLWVEHILERYKLPKEWRGDCIYAVGRKTGPLRERYPAFLYSS